jgi:hypothetical protein
VIDTQDHGRFRAGKPDLVAEVRGAAEAQGYPYQDIISGAGQDAA